MSNHFLIPTTGWGNNYHLAHYMFPACCQSENADQFTKFIGIVASVHWSSTHTVYYGNIAKLLTVAPLLVFSRSPQQVRSVTLLIT